MSGHDCILCGLQHRLWTALAGHTAVTLLSLHTHTCTHNTSATHRPHRTLCTTTTTQYTSLNIVYVAQHSHRWGVLVFTR
jgi:hypothetical protein